MSQQMAAALADRSVLGEYRGRDIIRTSLTIRNTGDGLSEAMGIDPQGSINTELLERQHNDGAHADGLVEGCPRCDEEQAALEAEAGN